MADLARQLCDYRLTTAEILYHLPDFPELLQTYIWQNYDVAPRFPVLIRFLDFWSHNIEGKLHTITVSSAALVSSSQIRLVDGEFRLH